MDKAFACWAGGGDQTRIRPKIFSAPILTGTLQHALSLTIPVILCSSVNTCHRGGKKRGIWLVDFDMNSSCGKILAAPSVRQNTDIGAMYKRKGSSGYF